MKKFDLNIEKILENWDVYHGIREIIANALDESLISATDDVKIYKHDDSWIIRDYGRGLKYTHLTQNENNEKLNSDKVIGKFGIGLKDALATFYRKGAKVSVLSKHNLIYVEMTGKQGFQDILTLHAIIKETTDTQFIGTEFKIDGIKDEDIFAAKNLFLKFSGEKILEDTSRGQIIEKSNKYGNVYINGVKVAEETDFLFSYNITALTAPIKKALNRERTNVGRTAYADTIKKILLSSSNSNVIKKIANDLQNISLGVAHDELAWIDVQEHAVKILNQTSQSVFVTSREAIQDPDMMDQAKDLGYNIIVIPENLKNKIYNSKDLSGNPIVDMTQLVKNYNNNFVFDFITEHDMNCIEKSTYAMTNTIVDLFGGLPANVKEIKISNTMVKNSGSCVNGLWTNGSQIIIYRPVLKSLDRYSGVLIHELIHAKTGYSDVTRDFESVLTAEIGKLCELVMLLKCKQSVLFTSLENKTTALKSEMKKTDMLMNKISNLGACRTN